MQIDSTQISEYSFWSSNWYYLATIIIGAFVFIFSIVKYRTIRDETKPRIHDFGHDEGLEPSLSFVITNHRAYSITVLSIYYKILYLGFISSRKYWFKNGRRVISNDTNPSKSIIIEKEENFNIPLANGELASDKKYKIYVKTSGGLCKAIVHPVVPKIRQRLKGKY